MEIEIRRMFILETLLSEGESTVSGIMARLWHLDAGNRESRFEPWAWYYNVTKPFSQMEKKGWIQQVDINEDGKKVFDITPEGEERFNEAIEEASCFQDSLFKRRKKSILSLVGS